MVPAQGRGGSRSPASRSAAPPRPSGQRVLVQAWWEQLDEVARRRLLRLAPGDFLPADAALDLQVLGVTVIAVGTVPGEDGYDALYEQPADVVALLAGVRGGRPR